jgi:hypothetical protein
MTQIVLDGAQIKSFVGQRAATSMAKHMRMDLASPARSPVHRISVKSESQRIVMPPEAVRWVTEFPYPVQNSHRGSRERRSVASDREEDEAVGTVTILHHIQPFVDFYSQRFG